MGKSIVIGTVWLSFQERNNCNRIMPICHPPKEAIEGWRNFAASKSSCLKKKVINGRRRGRLGSVGYTWLMVLRNVWRPRDKAWTQTMHLYWWGGTFIVSKSLEMDFASQIGFQAIFWWGISFVKMSWWEQVVFIKEEILWRKKFSNYSVKRVSWIEIEGRAADRDLK